MGTNTLREFILRDASLRDAPQDENECEDIVIRIALLVIVLVLAPTAAFFLWAWGVKLMNERKVAGTLPEWQELPLTWLAIAGLVCTIAGFIVMFFTQNQGAGGLLPT